jgi:hypothetical protein
MKDNRFGIGVMEMIAPWQKYETDLQYWYTQKPKYPGKLSRGPRYKHFWWNATQAWRVLRGKAVAISI